MLVYADLPKTPDSNVMLYCDVCQCSYSATRGDYWDVLEQFAECCNTPLRLVRKITRYEDVEL